MNPLFRHAGRFVAVILVFAVVAYLVATHTGCAASDAQKGAAADTAYGADQLDCVRVSTTREESKACRAARRSMWDAGQEAGR